MPPRHELNERFHGHIRRAERARAASTAFFATLTVLAVVGGGALAFHDIAPNTFARATAAPKHLASQVAAASSLPWLDGIADAIYRAVCPIFSTCENLASNSATTPANVKPTLPSKSNSYQATTSPNVKQGQQTHPAPAAGGATATQVAVSNQPTVVNQPVLERVIQTVREVQTPGVNAGYVDEKLSLLQNSLLLRMSAMENANATSFRSVSSSVSASAIAGVLGIGSGGTGLSSAPTYGELLLGNSLGGYTLTATSSLGLPTFADITASISSASFGKSWEIASGALAPTTTLGVLVSASSTFSGGVSIDRATTTSATSTSLFSTLGRFTTGIMDAFTAVTGTITNLTSTTLVAMNATTSSLFAGDLAASTARFGGTATSTFTSGGKLGIGVSSPTYHVDVAGFINTDQYSGYKQAGDTILYASSTNFATVNGISAGTKLQTLDTAIHNTAIGYQALNSASLTTTADYNTAVGSQALKANTTGAYNTAVGVALLGNTTGSYNSALGLNALTGNTTGSQNVALGNLALATATTSSNQTAVGYGALDSMITYSGNDTEGNVALGYNAGTSLTYGGANILIGFQAGDALTTGSNNIVLGYNIDAPDATANNQLVIGNTIFGLNVNSTGTTVDTDALIGIGTSTPYAKLSIINTGTGPSFVVEYSTSPDTTPFIIDTSGNVGIGTASPLSTLDVAGDAEIGGLSGSQSLFAYNSGRSSYGQLDLYNVSTGNVTLTTTFGSGNILLTPGATSGKVGIASTTPWRKFSVTGTVGFDGLTAGAGAGSLCLSANKEITYSDNAGCTGSSLRFKHDVATLTDGALDTVLALRPVSFVYNDDIGVQGEQVGFIAEEVFKIDPRLVTLDASSIPNNVKYANFTAILARAMQEIASITGAFKDALIAWLGSATNGLSRVHTQEICTTRSDGTEVCASADQLAAILAGTSAGAQTAGSGGSAGAPASSPAQEDSYADTATTTMPSETAPSESAAVPAANGEEAAGAASDVADAPEATGGSSAREVGADTSMGSTPVGSQPVFSDTPVPANDNTSVETPVMTGTE